MMIKEEIIKVLEDGILPDGDHINLPTRMWLEELMDYENICDKIPKEKILICTVGLPRSGKSTFCKEHLSSYPIVNPDSVRFAMYGQRFIVEAESFVWATVKVMIKALFRTGHQIVVFDATNTVADLRNDMRSSEYKSVYKVVNTDLEICKQRAIDDGMEDLVPIIERMSAYFDDLTEEEILYEDWLNESNIKAI